MKSFDLDGVITIGLYPGPDDVIITGRSFEEQPETEEFLKSRNIANVVYYNPLQFDQKTRVTSGIHKAKILTLLKDKITIHFEDDPIQWGVIEKQCPWITVVKIVHELTEKENVKRTSTSEIF